MLRNRLIHFVAVLPDQSSTLLNHMHHRKSPLTTVYGLRLLFGAPDQQYPLSDLVKNESNDGREKGVAVIVSIVSFQASRKEDCRIMWSVQL